MTMKWNSAVCGSPGATCSYDGTWWENKGTPLIDPLKRSTDSRLVACTRIGMVDPAVFAAVDEQRMANGLAPAYDFAKISGFAFGMGVERIAMIQHGISDIGQFYSGDMRFLEQFA